MSFLLILFFNCLIFNSLIQGAAEEGRSRSLPLREGDGQAVRHEIQRRDGQPGQTMRVDSFFLQAFRRRHDVRIPRAVELLRSDFIAKGCRDPEGCQPRKEARQGMPEACRRSGESAL